MCKPHTAAELARTHFGRPGGTPYTLISKSYPQTLNPNPYMGISPTRKRTPLETYRRLMLNALGGGLGRRGVFVWARYPCTP